MDRFAVIASVLASFLISGCNACEKLEESVCSDLGADDCALWREAGGPDMLYGGRRETRACINMSTGPTYEALLKGARAVVDAQKNVKAKAKKTN